MSALAIVLIAIAAIVAVFLLGGFLAARRRRSWPGWEQHIAQADRALEAARAADRGWDKELLHGAARRALSERRPDFEPVSLDLVLVDDRPGVEDDRAHLVAAGADRSVRVVLARDASGAWTVESVD